MPGCRAWPEHDSCIVRCELGVSLRLVGLLMGQINALRRGHRIPVRLGSDSAWRVGIASGFRAPRAASDRQPCPRVGLPPHKNDMQGLRSPLLGQHRTVLARESSSVIGDLVTQKLQPSAVPDKRLPDRGHVPADALLSPAALRQSWTGADASSRSAKFPLSDFHANFLAISSKLLGSNTTCDPV